MQHSPEFLKLVDEARPRVKEITVDEARERLRRNPKTVLLDVREDSIQDCYFVVDMFDPGGPVAAAPRSAHNGAGTLSFGDGHSELKKWRDPRTNPRMNPTGFVAIPYSVHPTNMDIVWLRERTTGRK